VTPGATTPPEPLQVAGLPALRPKTKVRWLGLWLDNKLKFDAHVKHWAGKTGAMAAHLRGLSKTVRGVPPVQAAVVARACVGEVALYGAEVWRRPHKPQAQLLRGLDRPLKQAARAVVPSYRTIQVAALQRESSILLAPLEVARRQERWQLRLAAAPRHLPCHTFSRLTETKARKNAAPKGTNLRRLWKGALKT